MHRKFEINRTKIKGGCQSGRKVVNHNSKIDLPLARVVDIRLRYVKMYFTYAQSVFVIWARVPKTGNKKFFLF